MKTTAKKTKIVGVQDYIDSATGEVVPMIVSETLALLQKGNFLKKIGYGRYMVNPDVMYKGSHRSRMGIVFDYSRCVAKEEQEKTEDTPDTESEKTPS